MPKVVDSDCSYIRPWFAHYVILQDAERVNHTALAWLETVVDNNVLTNWDGKPFSQIEIAVYLSNFLPKFYSRISEVMLQGGMP